jgi:HPt (histidine-containing phosphotransfer) domain-containing protein
MPPRFDDRSEPRVLDLPGAIDRFGGDQQLLRELTVIFLEDNVGLLQELKAALAEGDRERTERFAHSLKGIAANLGGQRVEAAAVAVEDAARAGRLERATLAIEPLTVELNRLVDALRRTVLAERTIAAD